MGLCEFLKDFFNSISVIVGESCAFQQSCDTQASQAKNLIVKFNYNCFHGLQFTGHALDTTVQFLFLAWGTVIMIVLGQHTSQIMTVAIIISFGTTVCKCYINFVNILHNNYFIIYSNSQPVWLPLESNADYNPSRQLFRCWTLILKNFNL